MNCEDVTVELANKGMIIRHPASADAGTECYVIHEAYVYTADRSQNCCPVPLSHLWLIWFGSLPSVAVITYLLVQVFGS